MKKKIWILGMIAGLLMSTTAWADPVPVEADSQALNPVKIEQEILKQMNQKRNEAGLPKLQNNSELSINADTRATELTGRFNHVRFDGRSFGTAITVPCHSYAENIAYYTAWENPQDEAGLAAWIVGFWSDSEVHNQNLLDARWEETGIGVYMEGDTVYVSQLYIEN